MIVGKSRSGYEFSSSFARTKTEWNICGSGSKSYANLFLLRSKPRSFRDDSLHAVIHMFRTSASPCWRNRYHMPVSTHPDSPFLNPDNHSQPQPLTAFPWQGWTSHFQASNPGLGFHVVPARFPRDLARSRTRAIATYVARIAIGATLNTEKHDLKKGTQTTIIVSRSLALCIRKPQRTHVKMLEGSKRCALPRKALGRVRPTR